MRLSRFAIPAATLLAAAILCLLAAFFASRLVENTSRTEVGTALDMAELDWAEVDVNGLQVFLIGEAPDEAARFEAVTVAGTVVDSARVIDQMLVAEPDDIRAPRFSVEILRNDEGISVIGLVPADTDREALIERFRGLVGEDGEVSDLLEVSDFPEPEGWDDALTFAERSMHDLPRSKVSVEAGRVQIKAMTDSDRERRDLRAVR